MKKLLTLTILALLVAGAGTLLKADYLYWYGDAKGNCMGYDILEDWIGRINTSNGSFQGYWGGELANDMDADVGYVVSISNYYLVREQLPGDWDADGYENCPCYGNWWGIFKPVTDDCMGLYDEDYGCSCDTAEMEWWGWEGTP